MILQAREEVARAMDSGLTTVYWHVGRRVRQDILKGKRAEYGGQTVSALGQQLEMQYGWDFSKKSLRHMIRFVEAFPDLLIVSTLLRQLSWNKTELNFLYYMMRTLKGTDAGPFKRWLARVGKERIDEIENPEMAMARMQELYEKKGYPKEWIDKRLHGIAVRQDLTDEWQNRGARTTVDYAILTNEIMQGAFDLKVDDYKQVKDLQRENLRDHMTDIELILTMLAEATITELHRDRDSHEMKPLKKDALDEVFKALRKELGHTSLWLLLHHGQKVHGLELRLFYPRPHSVELLDHIIFNRTEFFSFLEHGRL